MFGKVIDGQGMIENAVSVFEKTKKELESGIALCCQEEAELNDEIHELEVKKKRVLASKEKAKAVCKNIDKMLT